MAQNKNLRKSRNNIKLKTIPKKNRSKKQKTLKKILVPMDGSKNSFRALDMAISLSSHYSASITGVYIFDLPVKLEFSALDPVGPSLQKKVNKFMDQAKSRATKNNVKFTYIIRHDRTEPGIVTVAKEGKFDIIVIGKRHVSAFGEIFLGSVSHYLVHHSKIPVLIVK